LVELNVVEQCLNVFKTGIVQRKRNKARKVLIDAGKNPKKHEDEIFPRIHGLVFNPQTGKVKYIPVDFKHRVGSLDHIYGLYDMPTRDETSSAGDDVNANHAK
jgi:carbonic anhydrase